jgi:hypothetical protein
MAEIEIERRPRRSGWTWVALLLVLVGVAIGAWLILGSDTDIERNVQPAAETPSQVDVDVEIPAEVPPVEVPERPEGDGQAVPETSGSGGG